MVLHVCGRAYVYKYTWVCLHVEARGHCQVSFLILIHLLLIVYFKDIFVYVYVCIVCLWDCVLQELALEEAGCELPDVCAGSGPLGEQQALLTIKSSFQSGPAILFI